MTAAEFYNEVAAGWTAAETGRFDQAYSHYCKAEQLVDVGMNFPALLNMARHAQMDPSTLNLIEGVNRPFESTEDLVIGAEASDGVSPNLTPMGLDMVDYDFYSLVENIQNYKVDLEFHPLNLPTDMDHLFVMSTGRCGTTSLYRKIEQEYVAYHQHFLFPSHAQRLEQMCYMIAGVQNDNIARAWLKLRAAEWVGASLIGMRMANLNHLDTIFAPVFAQMHPKAEFIYVWREPRELFASFYGKRQFNRQLMPIYYSIPFEWCESDEHTEAEQILWYMDFTETFCRAFGKVYPGRWREVKAKDLFAGMDKHNEKAHKWYRSKEECYEIYDSLR